MFNPRRVSYLLLLALALAALGAVWRTPQPAAAQYDDPVEQGKYLTSIAGCIDCHTPLGDNGPDFTRAFAGGQPFDLGPLGVVFSANLTPDKDTGLGNWTDEEIKIAMRTGVNRDGLHLFPLMPYRFFNTMADSDVDAIVAYLRTLAPISNAVPRQQILPVEALPALPYNTGIVAPAPADTAARGKYLMESVIACTDCHTQVDPQTGAPLAGMYMAGGQPFAGPWGTVYGANLTPDKETGLGNWSDEDLVRLFRTGVRRDGRQSVLMPWQVLTSNMTEEDLNAIIYYLRNNVTAANNPIPAPAFNDGFEVFVELPKTATPIPWLWVGVLAAVIVVAVGAGLMVMRRKKA